MGTGRLSIDLSAIVANWQALAALARVDAAPVVKADAYGLGIAPVARALANAGARSFFVAYAEEGHALRRALGPGPQISILSGHMDTPIITIFYILFRVFISYIRMTSMSQKCPGEVPRFL